MRALALLLLPLLALAGEGEKPFKPYVALTGAQSSVKERAVSLVKALRRRHVGEPVLDGGYNWHYNEDHVTEVDFDQCMVRTAPA